MAKKKPFYVGIAAQTAQDMGSFYSLEEMGGTLLDQELPGLARCAQGAELMDSRFFSLQEEAHFVSLFEEEHEISDEDPYYYPGLLKAWQERPCPVGIAPALRATLAEGDADLLQQTSWQGLSQLLPACLLMDVRGAGLSLYDMEVDALYVYPSFDEQLDTMLLLLVGVSIDNGLRFPVQSKMTLVGETFAQVIEASRRQRTQIMQLWGNDPFDPHWASFSPFDDDDAVLVFAARLFALALSQDGRLTQTVTKDLTTVLLDYQPPAPVTAQEPEPREEAEDAPLAPVPEEAPEESDGLIFSQEQALDLHLQVEELQEQLAQAEARIASLTYNLSAAQERAQAAATAASLVQQQAALLESFELPQTPRQALNLAEQAFGDRLIVLENAQKSADDFSGSTAETWAVLRSIATILHPLVFGDGTHNIIRSFQSQSGFELAMRDSKATNRNSAFQKLRTVEYNGTSHDITPHVKGRPRGHKDLLRVHFFADYENQRIVIAHCGAHLPAASSAFL